MQPPSFSPNTVNQTVTQNGYTWKGQPGQSWTLQSGPGQSSAQAVSAPSFQDVLSNAGSLNTQLQTNIQPSMTTLGSISGDIDKKYKDLLANIIGPGSQSAVNAQTLATSNLLGNRGILPSSDYGQQQIRNALLPVEAQYGGLAGQLGVQESQSLIPIAQQLASLQNTYPEAINSALGLAVPQTEVAGQLGAANIQGLYGLQNTLAQINSPLALAQAQAAPYQPVGNTGLIFNARTGNLVNYGNTLSNIDPAVLRALGLS